MRPGVKKGLFYLLTVVLVWMATELTAVVAHGLRYHRLFSPDATRQAMAAVAAARADPSKPFSEVQKRRGMAEAFHPYLGFVADPYRNGREVSILGFPSGTAVGIPMRSPERTLVAVFGGSFAMGFTRLSAEKLEERLGELTGKEVVVLNFAKGAYKQPQQLFALAYMLSLGAELDVVLNLDGFNEVALALRNSLVEGVHPSYPAHWKLRVGGIPEAATLRELGRLELLRQRRRERAASFAGWRLYFSPTLSLVWRAADRKLEKAVGEQQGRLQRSLRRQSGFSVTQKTFLCLTGAGVPARVSRSLIPLRKRRFRQEHELLAAIRPHLGEKKLARYQDVIKRCAASSGSYTRTGPSFFYPSEDELFRDVVGLWKRSSLQMKALCDAAGIRYYHFLQPNQYVEGSKPMTEAERRIATRADHEYRPGVVGGYPLLRSAGRELVQEGIRFVDLTMVYRDYSEVLYRDDCCHVNARGHEVLAERILEEIASSWP